MDLTYWFGIYPDAQGFWHAGPGYTILGVAVFLIIAVAAERNATKCD